MYENETDLRIAERELAAFYTAVLKAYGPQEASNAARDWIEALESMDCGADGGLSDWRPVTVAAAACLATRVVSLPVTR